MNRTNRTISLPHFIGDHQNVLMDPVGRQVDWSYLTDDYRDGAKFAQLNGAVAAAATSMTVDPLDAPLHPGQALYFGQAGEFVRVSAPAAKGATTVSIDAAPSALEDNDRAYIPNTGTKRTIKAGTTMVLLTSGKMVPRAVRPGAETAVGFIVSSAEEDNPAEAATGYGLMVGGAVWDSLLPEATGGPPPTLSSTYKTELGARFYFRTYADNSAS